LNIIYILIVDYETTIRCIAMSRVYRTCLFIARIVVQSYAFIPHNTRALSRISRVTRFEIRRMHSARITAYWHSGCIARRIYITKLRVAENLRRNVCDIGHVEMLIVQIGRKESVVERAFRFSRMFFCVTLTAKQMQNNTSAYYTHSVC